MELDYFGGHGERPKQALQPTADRRENLHMNNFNTEIRGEGEYVAVAKRDYRDVLFWAEYPEESRLDTPEKRERVRKMFEKFGIKPPDDL